jgi:hypothetical protein
VWVRVAAALYPCLTGVAVLATGNHFVLDMVGGLIDIGLALLIVRFFLNRLPPSRALLDGAARKLPFLAKSDSPA